jgi:hypothetical protein
MEYAHISFDPKKCKILIHNAEKILIPPLSLPDANGTEQEVEVCNIKGTIKNWVYPQHKKVTENEIQQEQD